MPRQIQGTVHGQNRRLAIVVSRFNNEITAKLLEGALRASRDLGVADDAITVVSVPGAVEIPLAAQALAGATDREVLIKRRRFDAIVALGAVIRGETSHYDHVCSMVAAGVNGTMLGTGVPVAFGVLTCDTDAQALSRCGPGKDNKGYEAVLVALEMAGLMDELAQ